MSSLKSPTDFKKILYSFLEEHHGLQINQFSYLLVASINQYTSSNADSDLKAEQLLDFWFLLTNSDCKYPLSLKLTSTRLYPSLFSNDSPEPLLIIYYNSFSSILQFCSNFFSKKSSTDSKNNPKSTYAWEFSHSVRIKALSLWFSLISRSLLIFHPPDKNLSDPSKLLTTVNDFFMQSSNFNFLAYCICGFLDNASDPIQTDVSEYSLNILLYLLSTSAKVPNFQPINYPSSLNLYLPTSRYLPSFLNDKSLLINIFPGLVSSLIKISIGKSSGSLSKADFNNSFIIPNYKPHIRSKSICILSLAIQICFSNSSNLPLLFNSKNVSSNIFANSKNDQLSSLASLAHKYIVDNFAPSDPPEILGKLTDAFSLLDLDPDSWETSSSSKLVPALKNLLSLRLSDNDSIVSQLISLFGSILNDCYILLSELIPISLQLLLISQFNHTLEQRQTSSLQINSFLETIFLNNEILSPSLKVDTTEINKKIQDALIFWYDEILSQFPFFINNENKRIQTEGLYLISAYSNLFLFNFLEISKLPSYNSLSFKASQSLKHHWSSSILPSLAQFLFKKAKNSLNSNSLEIFSKSIESIDPLQYFLYSVSKSIGVEYALSTIQSKLSDPTYRLYRSSYLNLLSLIIAPPSQNEEYLLLDSPSKDDLNPISPLPNPALLHLDEATINDLFELLIDESVSLVALSQDNYSKSLSKKTLSVQRPQAFSQLDIFHINSVLSTLKEVIIYKKESVVYYLSEIMFPLLSLMQKSSHSTKTLASQCLQAISDATGSLNVSDLLTQNADFIIDTCSQRVRGFSFTFDVFNVLTSTINILEPQMAIVMSADVVDDVLDLIEIIVKDGHLSNKSIIRSVKPDSNKTMSLDSGYLSQQMYISDSSNGIQTLIKCLDFLNIITAKIKDLNPPPNTEAIENQPSTVELLISKLNERNSADSFDEDLVTDIQKDEVPEDDAVPSGIKTKPSNHIQKISVKIMMMVQNFISHSNTHVQLLSLKILQNVIPTLSDTNELLPLINHVWPIIISCLKDPDYDSTDSFYITLACLELVSQLCFYSKEWLLSRIKSDIWPNIYKQLYNMSNPINNLLLSRYSSFYSSRNLENLTDSSISPTIAIVNGYIKTLSNIFLYIPIGHDISLDASILLVRFLDKDLDRTISDSAYTALESLLRSHSDTVWLVIISFGDIHEESSTGSFSGHNDSDFSYPSELIEGISHEKTFNYRSKLAKELSL
ncbi:hypothetical protein AYI68_g3111 [Smittium mucronatum]|uniref:TTI1 C-terminal TPR domain-containing protein n=1 Tax=Smittium mucronatum TaxID=133383 RepID=A0A1R0H0V3_9FUNG|nr:hypothetical protein AYI68_g3111 [Smittium mucronatum]